MTAKRVLAVLGTGLVGAQAGHLLAYALRFGSAAPVIQSTGEHAYFFAAAKTVAGFAAVALLASLLIIGAGRVASGRRLQAGSAPSFVRLLAVLYTVQLGCFAAQETLESLVGGAHASSAPLLLLWGAAGQLPVALAATLALRWLWARLRPALAALRVQLLPNAYAPAAMAWRSWPAATLPATGDLFGDSYVRGPPSS